MIKKTINTLFLISFFIFFFLVTKHYFSEENIIFTNKSRTFYEDSQSNLKNNLPLLKNDTDNIIVNINDLENFKNNRKKRFWEKLISNNNE